MKIAFRLSLLGMVITTCFFAFSPVPVHALDVGTNVINQSIQLGSDSPITIITRIINIAMIFLGVIAVSIVLFAGFKWMTAAGNEDRILEAKGILKNGLIGLVIVLSSWGIASFVLGRLVDQTTNGNQVNTGSPDGYGQNLGLGAIGSCTVQSVYPQPDQKESPRNASIIVTFKETLDLATVCANASGAACACGGATSTCNLINPKNIRIFETTAGDACDKAGICKSPNTNITDVIVSPSSDKKTLVLSPRNYLGSPIDSVWYTVYFSNSISKADGSGIFSTCSTDYFRWQFQVSNKLDLTPPQVVSGGVFPSPDSGRDVRDAVASTDPVQAKGSVQVLGATRYYKTAVVSSVAKGSADPNLNVATAVIDPNYHKTTNKFTVSLVTDSKAQLFDTDNAPLGVEDLNGNSVYFKDYFTLTVGGDGKHKTGNSWIVNVTPEQAADVLRIGNDTYTFVNGSSTGFNIRSLSGWNAQAQEITVALSGRSDVEVNYTINTNTVSLAAKIAGQSGNSIFLGSGDANILKVTPFNGGVDKKEVVKINGVEDQPMNTGIQINFSESMNPVTVSGSSNEVGAYLRVVNNESTKLSGAACVKDADCRSFKCESSKCTGSFLAGRFSVANNYQTVEFVSDNQCGMNGCGEPIYCLPANSNLAVEIQSASLAPCATAADCAAKSPYTRCIGNICKNSSNENFPLANISSINGLTDASLNSLDGNRNGVANGPLSFYNENNKVATTGDNYLWSFFISSQLNATAPQITGVQPSSNASTSDLNTPIKLTFNKLIMNSTLQTGSLKVSNGTSTVEHKLLNLISTSPVGYWIVGNNHYTNGQPDYTEAQISHSTFFEGVNYSSQVGSGVKDIYQNCFKPSSGPGCVASELNPSCCDGTPTNNLNQAGNCL